MEVVGAGLGLKQLLAGVEAADDIFAELVIYPLVMHGINLPVVGMYIPDGSVGTIKRRCLRERNHIRQPVAINAEPAVLPVALAKKQRVLFHGQQHLAVSIQMVQMHHVDGIQGAQIHHLQNAIADMDEIGFCPHFAAEGGFRMGKLPVQGAGGLGLIAGLYKNARIIILGTGQKRADYGILGITKTRQLHKQGFGVNFQPGCRFPKDFGQIGELRHVSIANQNIAALGYHFRAAVLNQQNHPGWMGEEDANILVC